MDTSLSEANFQQIGFCHEESVRVLSHISTGYVIVYQSQRMTEPFI
jgi:hypothetical protein